MCDRRNRAAVNIAIMALGTAFAPIGYSFCGQDELDAQNRCEIQIHQNNCSCVKIHDVRGCYIYGKENFQCRWHG